MYTSNKSAQCTLQISYNFVKYTSIKLKEKNYAKWVNKAQQR